jgi:hypothetical protein
VAFCLFPAAFPVLALIFAAGAAITGATRYGRVAAIRTGQVTYSIHIGPNIRTSPYFEATVADGVRSFSVYNHMAIPGHFGDPEAEYDRLLTASRCGTWPRSGRCSWTGRTRWRWRSF